MLDSTASIKVQVEVTVITRANSYVDLYLAELPAIVCKYFWGREP